MSSTWPSWPACHIRPFPESSNGHPSVRDSTRRRVLEAVEALDYRPNVAARALASRRSGVIGVLAMETKLLGPAATLYFIERAARSAGFFLSIATVHGSASDAISEAVDHLILQGVEGVVAIAPVDGAVTALSAIPPDLSVVVVEGDEGAAGRLSVSTRWAAPSSSRSICSTKGRLPSGTSPDPTTGSRRVPG